MRLGSLLAKEFIQFFRDPVMLFLILWLYTVEVVICAYALGLDQRHLPLAVIDQDLSAASRSVTDAVSAADAFELVARAPSLARAEDWLASGRAVAVLTIPEGFGRRLERGEEGGAQLLLDGSDANTAAVARGYALQMLQSAQRRWAAERGLEAPAVQPRLRVWYNPDQTNTSFIVLSMIALAGLMVGVIHPAAAIVREKEQGTLEQLRVAPIGPAQLFLAKTVPTVVVGMLAVLVSLGVVAWFGVPLTGSLALFLVLTLLFLLSAIGLGVLVAAVAGTLQQALLLAFFGLFPVMFLSGTLVPVESMPGVLERLSLASPLRHYLEIILGVFLKGSGWASLWPHAAALVAIGLPLFGLAYVLFRRQYR